MNFKQLLNETKLKNVKTFLGLELAKHQLNESPDSVNALFKTFNVDVVNLSVSSDATDSEIEEIKRYRITGTTTQGTKFDMEVGIDELISIGFVRSLQRLALN